MACPASEIAGHPTRETVGEEHDDNDKIGEAARDA